MPGEAFMEDETIVIEMGERQDLRDPPLEQARSGPDNKTQCSSEASSSVLSPRPKLALSRPVDRPRPSSASLSPQPILNRSPSANKVGPDIEAACSGGLPAVIRSTDGVTPKIKKSGATNKKALHKIAKSVRSSRKKSKRMPKLPFQDPDETALSSSSLRGSNIQNRNRLILHNLNRLSAEEIWEVGCQLGV
ncbi:hypothetical protein Ancab_032148 [Ancistrocladus abbreviatus]